MQGWQTSYLGLRDLPRELSEFELQAFFSFSRNELELIARRRGDNHKLGLALHIGFVRMSGRRHTTGLCSWADAREAHCLDQDVPLTAGIEFGLVDHRHSGVGLGSGCERRGRRPWRSRRGVQAVQWQVRACHRRR